MTTVASTGRHPRTGEDTRAFLQRRVAELAENLGGQGVIEIRLRPGKTPAIYTVHRREEDPHLPLH